MSDEEVGKGIGEIPDGPFYPGATQSKSVWPHLKRFNAGTVSLGMVDWLSYARLEIAMGDRGRPYS
jgi:hypothetical protein